LLLSFLLALARRPGLSFNAARKEDRLLRRAQLERLLDWAWDQYDWLSDWQRVGLGVALTLLLASASMYCLGAASLVALSRQPDTANAEPAATATAPVFLLPVATEVEPISPLLADRTPTLRPTVTPTVRGATGATPTSTSRPAASPSGPLLPGNAAVTTPTRTSGPLASATPAAPPTPPRSASPSPTATRAAAGQPRALPWGDVPSPSPARTGAATVTPTRAPGR
jgi:hypothetical protein